LAFRFPSLSTMRVRFPLRVCFLRE
jgi:hypothetical protein